MGDLKICLVKYNVEKNRKAYMFEMPEKSYFEEGDTVIVPDVSDNEREATVIDTVSFNLRYESDKEELNRLLNVAGVELPLKKVLGKVKRTYYIYEDEVKEDENSTNED